MAGGRAGRGRKEEGLSGITAGGDWGAPPRPAAAAAGAASEDAECGQKDQHGEKEKERREAEIGRECVPDSGPEPTWRECNGLVLPAPSVRLRLWTLWRWLWLLEQTRSEVIRRTSCVHGQQGRKQDVSSRSEIWEVRMGPCRN